MVRLFAAPQGFVTYVFIPGICMKLPDSKSPVSQARHCARQIRSATRFHFSSLPRCRLWLCVAEGARGHRFAACTDRVPRRDTNRTSRVRIGRDDSPANETIEIRLINVRITECSAGMESQLVCHD